jgi:serine/threonine-protein kinase HipA
MGDGNAPGIPHLKKLAEKFGIAKSLADQIIDEVRGAINRWPQFAEKAGVSKASNTMIWKILKNGC